MAEWCDFDCLKSTDRFENENVDFKYRRNLNPSLNDSDSLCFQWTDIDMTSGSALESNPAGGITVGISKGIVPIIRLYGVTNEGYSVTAMVYGFVPYFFVSVPDHINFAPSSLAELRDILDQRVNSSCWKFNQCFNGLIFSDA